MKGFNIRETNPQGYTETVKRLVRTSRGWSAESKIWKTEAAAKAWISRREKQVNNTGWSWEIVATH